MNKPCWLCKGTGKLEAPDEIYSPRSFQDLRDYEEFKQKFFPLTCSLCLGSGKLVEEESQG